MTLYDSDKPAFPRARDEVVSLIRIDGMTMNNDIALSLCLRRLHGHMIDYNF